MWILRCSMYGISFSYTYQNKELAESAANAYKNKYNNAFEVISIEEMP